MSEEFELDQKYINRALELAVRGEGRVEPNPVVGAVLVKDNRIIGEGWHEYFGGPHAEINALNNAAESPDGSTLYISLEPCAHFGKTPPCVDAVIKAGVKKVVLAVRDPNPITAGKGAATLKKAGIEVVEGINERKAREINAPFFKLHLEGLPYIIAKWAMSLDGKIAARTGDARWISSEESRAFVHQFREKMGAIMVGIRTVLNDDPSLLGRVAGAAKNPRRIILDSFARLPLESRIIKTLPQAETYLVVSANAPQERVKKIYELGVKIFEIEEVGGALNFIKLGRKLAESGINKILIEGGSSVLASAFEANLVDEIMVFIAPKIIGGKEALSPVGGKGIELIKDALQLEEFTVEHLGSDLLIRSHLKRH